jgi:hypothetical protein
MEIISCYSFSVLVMNFSSFRFISSPFLLHQTRPPDSVRTSVLWRLMVGYIRGIPLSYPYLLAFITFPICAFKNWINVIQMVNAAKALAEVDKDDRQKEGTLTSPRPKRSTAGKRNRMD